MGYRTLAACVADLERHQQLVRVDVEVDPYLEVAEIQRRVYRAGGPALLFTNAKGCRFPLVCNLFGTRERARFLFRDTWDAVCRLVELKTDPATALRRPRRAVQTLRAAWHTLPKRVRRTRLLDCEITVAELPQIQSWPDDGGAFVTLPLVYTEDPDAPGWKRSNLGMYRVQLSGGRYEQNRQVGLHYQIHRGIGVHHAAAIRRGVPLRVNVFVGGPPALTLAAVMPLPEGMPEITFAGALAGHRIPLCYPNAGLPLVASADFCIAGVIEPRQLLPEGPFGDHLGYYSTAHDFPVMRVERVYHRTGAIWPFTVVGRPPQEDSTFGQIVHELTGPALPSIVPGLRAVHAVDEAGVHPLLLAIGSERYVPYAERRRPQELLTLANALLGQGQLSLAKYLWIVAGEDDPALDIHDVEKFLCHALRRVDWSRDLHFQTQTTIDTLDYTGTALNEGSKLVIAAVGPPVRQLSVECPGALRFPDGFHSPRLALPGVLVIAGPAWESGCGPGAVEALARDLEGNTLIAGFPLIVVVDDSEFAARNLSNWLWVTFTRSNPAADVHGVAPFVAEKHWGCRGSLLIDARSKAHHAPPLIEDPGVSRHVDQLASRGGPLHGIF